QALGGPHRDRAHDAVAELLLHFERQVGVLQLQRLVDERDGVARELDVDDGADDLGDGAFGRVSVCHGLRPTPTGWLRDPEHVAALRAEKKSSYCGSSPY